MITVALALMFGVAAEASATRDCKIENSWLRRRMGGGGHLRTVEFANKLTGKSYKFGADEFRVTIDGGAEKLTSKDFRVTGLDAAPGGCTYSLINDKTGVRVKAVYTLGKDDFWTRKRLEIEAGAHLVNEIDVERFDVGRMKVERFDSTHDSKPPWDWPGGRPVFIDGRLFAGLEYPAGWNEAEKGVVRLHHYPGRKGRVVSKSAVIGVAADEKNRRVSDAFAGYLGSIRVHPPRRFVLWNAYFNKYDGAQASSNYSDTAVKKKVLAGKRAFADTGARIDAVLVDGGWAEPKSLMEEDRRAPNRLKLVRELAEKYLNCPIGVHVITHGRRATIDKEWLKSNFDMIDGIAYCFADPRASDLEIKNLLDVQRRHGIAAFKFDWGNFHCTKTDHRGHLPGDRYAREAITDNTIRMLQALHDADPNVFLYNTGWFSPWWLMYYDAVFSGENDYNTGLVGPPAFCFNDMQESWRDEVIRRNLVAPRPQFPIGALMNHSPISFRWTIDSFKSDKGPADSFANAILMNYLRGNGLIEFYMNVFNLTDAEKQLWGQITKWATANDDILLANSFYMGGDPFRAEPYGYAHFNGKNQGIIGIRNPGITGRSFSFVLDENIGFKADGGRYEVREGYPRETVLGAEFKYGDRVKVPVVGRGGVTVLFVNTLGQVSANQAQVSAAIENPSAEKLELKQTAGATIGKYKVKVPAGLSAKLVVLIRMGSYKDQKQATFDARVNGAPAAVRRTENFTGLDKEPVSWEPSYGWVLNEVELPAGESKVDFSASGGVARAWLMSQGPEDASLPVFDSGLPAAWRDAVKNEIELF